MQICARGKDCDNAGHDVKHRELNQHEYQHVPVKDWHCRVHLEPCVTAEQHCENGKRELSDRGQQDKRSVVIAKEVKRCVQNLRRGSGAIVDVCQRSDVRDAADNGLVSAIRPVLVANRSHRSIVFQS